MAQLLEVAQLAHEHCVPEVQVGCGGVEPGLDAQRDALDARLFEARAQGILGRGVGCGDEFGDALGDEVELIVYRREASRGCGHVGISKYRRCVAMTEEKRLEREILQLLAQRGEGKTICPSEAARAVAGDERDAWEPLMDPARAAAQRLVAAGKIVVTQGGQVVDGRTASGPIRLRLR